MVDESTRITGSIGGQPTQAYWTPDGRVIKAMPDIHHYALKDKDEKVISSGTRDANLDRGWLTQKPSELKLYCPHCDNWHDTEDEIKQCESKNTLFVAKCEKKAKKELGGDRVGKLETEMGEIKSLLKQLLERLNG